MMRRLVAALVTIVCFGVLLAACGTSLPVAPAPSSVSTPMPSTPMPSTPMPSTSMPHGADGTPGPVEIPFDALRIDVVGKEFSFLPEEVAVQAARPVALTFENDGTAAHDWTVHAEDGTELAHAHAEPGESAVIVMSLKTGSYKVWCTVAGHKQAGMVGTLVVT